MDVFIYIIMAGIVITAITMIVRRSRPRGIVKEAKRLQGLFWAKEGWERYLAGLNELEQGDAGNDGLRGSVRAGYQQRVAETIEEIAGVKSTLRRELEDKQRICQAYQVERERLAGRFKMGELLLQKYEASERKLRKKTELIERDINAIERLISAESSGEVQSYRGTVAQKPFVQEISGRKTTKAESLPEDGSSVKRSGSSRLLKILGIVGAIIVVAVVVALLIEREVPASAHPWPMYGHDAQWSFRSSYTGPEMPIISWDLSLPDVAGPPVIGANGSIYFSELQDGLIVITVLDLEGNTRKTVRVTHESLFGDIGVLLLLAPEPNATLYMFCAAEHGAILIAFDATMEELWRTHFDVYTYFPWFSTIGPDGTIYSLYFDDDEEAWCLEAVQNDGSRKWTFALPGIRSNVAVSSQGITYVYQEDGRVCAYDSQGEQKWCSAVLPGLRGNYERCWLALGLDDTLYVLPIYPVEGSSDHARFYVLTPSGDIRWHGDIQESISDTVAWAVGPNSELYIHFWSETLYRIDKGGQLTSFATITGPFVSSILVDSANNVYACGSDNLYAFSSDGSLKWELPISMDDAYLEMGSDGTIYVWGTDSNYEQKLSAISHALVK